MFRFNHESFWYAWNNLLDFVTLVCILFACRCLRNVFELELTELEFAGSLICGRYRSAMLISFAADITKCGVIKICGRYPRCDAFAILRGSPTALKETEVNKKRF